MQNCIIITVYIARHNHFAELCVRQQLYSGEEFKATVAIFQYAFQR